MGKKHKELEKILDTPIDKSLIKEIEIGRGETASYIPIKNILDLANKVFGFSNWSVEYLNRTIETVQVEVRDKTPVDYVIITQHVRVSVQIQDETEEEDCTIHSEGVGFVTSPKRSFILSGVDGLVSKAMARAVKKAFKRFGKQFGLMLDELYDEEDAPAEQIPAPKEKSVTFDEMFVEVFKNDTIKNDYSLLDEVIRKIETAESTSELMTVSKLLRKAKEEGKLNDTDIANIRDVLQKKATTLISDK